MVPIHGNVYVAQMYLYNMCNVVCKSRETCSYRLANMLCTSYCKCKADEQCTNDNVKHIDQCDNSEQDCDEKQ